MKATFNPRTGINRYSIHFEGSVDDHPCTPVTLPDVPLRGGHSACPGCDHAFAVNECMRTILSMGKVPAVALGTGCLEVFSTQGTRSNWGSVPAIHNNFPNAASTATGLARSLAVRKANGLTRDYAVVAFAGDGGTADIGLQSLSGAAQRNEDFIYICLDNEAYMNTGIQKSGTTPYGIWTTTSPSGEKVPANLDIPKNMPQIMAAHNVPYVATATPAFQEDFRTKIRKAVLIRGLRYIHVLSVCPEGWKSPTESLFSISKLAVETGAFPLYEIEADPTRGIKVITLNSPVRSLRPIGELYRLQKRASPLLNEESIMNTSQQLVVNNLRMFEEIYSQNGWKFPEVCG